MRQRTRTINALREHLAEYGVVAPTGIAPVGRLAAIVDGEEGTLPAPVVELARVLLGQVATLSAQVDALEKQLRQRAASDAAVRPLMTIPGIGVIAATALTTFAPPPETFAKGRDFTAWVGLTPRQHSSGGKERLGKTSKMRRRDIRRLLIIGAVATVRWAARKGAPERCRSLTQPPPPAGEHAGHRQASYTTSGDTIQRRFGASLRLPNSRSVPVPRAGVLPIPASRAFFGSGATAHCVERYHTDVFAMA